MKNRLMIIGAGGFGREVLGWIEQIPEACRDWSVAGFLDSNPKALSGFNVVVPILGDPWHYTPSEHDVFVCAIGNTRTKLDLCAHLLSKGARFQDIVHPTAIVGPSCHIGRGCILCPGAVVTTNVRIGDFVILNVHATVGHDAEIGDGCTLSGHVDVTGGARLGRGVFLGSHACVLPLAEVGDFSIVGAGSVVLKRVRPNTTVMGVPAQKIMLPRQTP